MNAEQARQLTRENLRGPGIAHLQEIAVARIEQAARGGRSNVNDAELFTQPGWKASCEQRGALWAWLASLGYTVKHHPDPDPGHPASRAYTTVSW